MEIIDASPTGIDGKADAGQDADAIRGISTALEMRPLRGLALVAGALVLLGGPALANEYDGPPDPPATLRELATYNSVEELMRAMVPLVEDTGATAIDAGLARPQQLAQGDGVLLRSNWISAKGSDRAWFNGAENAFLRSLFEKVARTTAERLNSGTPLTSQLSGPGILNRCRFFHGHMLWKTGGDLLILFHTAEYPSDLDDKCGAPAWGTDRSERRNRLSPNSASPGYNKASARAHHNVVYSLRQNSFFYPAYPPGSSPAPTWSPTLPTQWHSDYAVLEGSLADTTYFADINYLPNDIPATGRHATDVLLAWNKPGLAAPTSPIPASYAGTRAILFNGSPGGISIELETVQAVTADLRLSTCTKGSLSLEVVSHDGPTGRLVVNRKEPVIDLRPAGLDNATTFECR